ncbi:MAG: hypothetical protein HFF29_04445 [Oscillospiraceae bacterium]|nr:hypothetical protein [Oscillospiraceae bacterium]
MGYWSLLFLGIILMIGGVFNMKGNIVSIHWYNRARVTEADAPKYGKAMGLGILIAGGSIALTAILQMIFDVEPLFWIAAAGTAAGVAVILFAQFKYNRGIF